MKWLNVILIMGLTAGLTAAADDIQLPDPRQSGGRPLLSALKDRHSSRDFMEKELPLQTISDDDRYKFMIGCIDAGHISQNVYLFCASEGLGCVARASVDREQFSSAFDLPDTMNVIFGQTVGYVPDE